MPPHVIPFMVLTFALTVRTPGTGTPGTPMQPGQPVQPRASRLWTNVVTPPYDPTVSCYQCENQTWNCATDLALQRNVDAEDSY